MPPSVTGQGLANVKPTALTSILTELAPKENERVPLLDVRVANFGSPTVEAISIWPFVPAAVTFTLFDPSPTNTPNAVNKVCPVPPIVTGKGLGKVKPANAGTSIFNVFGPNVKVRELEVIVPKAGSPPVAAKSTWPSVPGAVTSKLFCPSPMSTPKEVRRVSPVPPIITGIGLGIVNPLMATSTLIELGPNTKVRLPPDEVIVPKAGSPPVAAKSI